MSPGLLLLLLTGSLDACIVSFHGRTAEKNLGEQKNARKKFLLGSRHTSALR
jgi:hypothetical protein